MARNVPEWWISSNEAVKEYLYRVASKGKVSVAGHSAGGREILMYEYGEKEDLPQKVSFSSAYAAKKPELYTRASERKKPVLFIYAAIHGAEIEGCAALMNLVNLLEKGYDVLMLRDETDVRLDNVARTVIANNVADCHVSLHWDGDGLDYDKGCFYVPVPDEIKEMEPVKSHASAHESLGTALIEGLRDNGCMIYEGTVYPQELTQTCYSTIPSAVVELGNNASKHDDATLEKLADGLLAGIESFIDENK